MKIKRSSWHYKLNKWFSYPDFHKWNLCRYFWVTMLKLAVVVSAVFGALFVLYMLVTDIPVLILTTFVLSSVALPVLVIFYLRHWLGKPVGPTVGEEQSSLIFEWLKAKKDKVCPFIEFTN